ncbi:MAG: hypothetical protein IJD92_00235 [Bacilli bacterium]|nr:hypothetical protein [Bacilli bacterium]
MKKYKAYLIFILIIIISIVFVKKIKSNDSVEYVKYDEGSIHAYDDLKYNASTKKYSLKEGTLNYFDIAYDETGALMFLVNGVSWDFDDADSHSIIKRMGYSKSNAQSWYNYYTKSSTAKAKYSKYELFRNDIELYINSACQVKRNILRDKNNMDFIDDFNNNLCVKNGIVEELPFVACSNYDKSVPTLTLVTDTGTKEFGYLYYEKNARIVDLGEGDCQDDRNAWVPRDIYQRSADANNKNKACTYFKELYNAGLLDQGDFETIPVDCSIVTINNSENCQKKAENHYVDIKNLRIDRCLENEDESSDEEVDPSTCINYDESAPMLELDNYKFAYSYQVGKGSMLLEINATEKNGCLDERNIWVYPEIKNKAIDKGIDPSKVCDYFRTLYNSGLLDQGDYNFAIDNGCYIADITFEVCQTKGIKHFVDSKNIRIDSCEPEDKSYCSIADFSKKLYKKQEKKYYQVGYISSMPEFYVGDCSNIYSVKGIIEQFEGGCVFVQDLASRGILTELQVNEAKSSGCSINIEDKSCKVVATSKNNVIYSYDGFYVFEENYNNVCSKDNSNLYDIVKYEGFLYKDDSVNKVCDYAINSTVKNTSIAYHNETFDIDHKPEEFLLSNNEYCKVTCQEKFAYTYPNIFETVKSGTHFEFMYNPEIYSSRICKTEFDYNEWEVEYQKAIKKELEALNNWLITKTFDSEYHPRTCTEYVSCFVDGKLTTCSENYDCSYYTYDFSELYCDDNNVCVVNTYDDYGSNPKNQSDYENIDDLTLMEVYNERKNLEKNNIGCFTALDNLESNKSIVSNKFIYNEEDLIFNNSVDVVFSNLVINGSDFEYTTEEKNNIATNVEFNTHNNSINYFNLQPEINFRYEYKDGDFNNDKLELITKRLVKDTGAYTKKEGNVYKKDNNTKSFVFSINGINYTFNAFKFDEIKRYISKYYEYQPNNNYYIDYSSDAEGKICLGSCSSKSVLLGNVYPVSLVTEGQKKVYFSLGGTLGHDGSLNDKLEGDIETAEKNVYSCDYQVINDVLEITEEEKFYDDKKYKANFYIRSISTSDVDPNNRRDAGLLGTNWASDKGQSLIKLIEKKSKGNNTYNPSNLEYSFTLNALTIEAIRKYNETHDYSDFNLKCNDMGGECKSVFLTELSGKGNTLTSNVEGIKVNNVNAYMPRKTWKYYINSSWIMSDTLTNSSNWIKVLDNQKIDGVLLNKMNSTCDSSLGLKNFYNCIYKDINEGVLP